MWQQQSWSGGSDHMEPHMPNTQNLFTQSQWPKSPTGFLLGNTPTSLPITLHYTRPSTPLHFYLFIIILEIHLIKYSIFVVLYNFQWLTLSTYIDSLLSLTTYCFASQRVMKFGVKIFMFVVFVLLLFVI